MELADLVATMPFAVAVGITIDAAAKEEVVGRLPWSEERCTTIVVQTELHDANDKLVALVTQTQAVLSS